MKKEVEIAKQQKSENTQMIQLRHGLITVKKELAKHEKMPMNKAHPK
jgi:hypothetical protein